MSKRSRIYWRTRGGARRAYLDLRDLGGGREPLVAPGDTVATTDPALAELLAAHRVAALLSARAARQQRAVLGLPPVTPLGPFAEHHLAERRTTGAVRPETLEEAALYLRRAVAYFGVERDLGSITTPDVARWLAWLRTQENGRGGRLGAWTARHHLGALSNLFRRARAEGAVLPGTDPVGDLVEKPRATREESTWLEPPDAALVLATALREPGMLGPLVATFLLTGGREAEVLGLEVDDIHFARRTVTFRPNRWRPLKTPKSERTLMLWPQLEEILRAYVFGAERPPSALLFPSYRTGREAMLTDVRKWLDQVTAKAGEFYVVRDGVRRRAQVGDLRTKVFRHTYISTRLQTLDHGAPVQTFTVAREVGHGSTAMIERVYGHLGTIRHRSEVPEYRIAAVAPNSGDREAARS